MPGVMIVDDNVVSVMELEEALSIHSFHGAGVAYSGIEAVTRVERGKNERESLFFVHNVFDGLIFTPKTQ